MKRLITHLLSGIGGVVTGLSVTCSATTPPLIDFGHGNMTTRRTVPNAIILVNFTNNTTTETTQTKPFKMGNTLVRANYDQAVNYYSNWFFSRTSPPGDESVNGYFYEISNGRFQWTPAIVCMLPLSTNDLYSAINARVNPEKTNLWKADVAYMDLMISKAMAQGLNLRSYDDPARGGDKDGVVSARECTIQLIINDKTFGGGGARNWVGLTNLPYYGYVTIQEYNLGLGVLAEELIHVLQNGKCGDIYGPSGMSGGFTAMSSGLITHADPWHKLQMAWCEPRIVEMAAVTQLKLPAAQLMKTNAPVILYDPDSPKRGTQEFFILEYRSTNTTSGGPGYEKQLKDSGLVIWHIQQNSAKVPVNYSSTYFPSAQLDWRRCQFCRGLFQITRADWPCPQGGTNHVAENGGDDEYLGLPCNDPYAGGTPGWCSCKRCGQLFYLPNKAQSRCAAGGTHEPGPCEVSLRHNNDPEALGTRGWRHCLKCQSLYRPTTNDKQEVVDAGDCAAGEMHEDDPQADPYTLLWMDGVPTMMTEGSPYLRRSRGDAWHSDQRTPALRWFDGTYSQTRIRVFPFTDGDDEITIEIQANYRTWVDFRNSGLENGSFENPFNTFGEGVNAVLSDGVLHIKSGTTPEIRRVTKPMQIEAYGGSVTIGQR